MLQGVQNAGGQRGAGRRRWRSGAAGLTAAAVLVRAVPAVVSPVAHPQLGDAAVVVAFELHRVAELVWEGRGGAQSWGGSPASCWGGGVTWEPGMELGWFQFELCLGRLEHKKQLQELQPSTLKVAVAHTSAGQIDLLCSQGEVQACGIRAQRALGAAPWLWDLGGGAPLLSPPTAPRALPTLPLTAVRLILSILAVVLLVAGPRHGDAAPAGAGKVVGRAFGLPPPWGGKKTAMRTAVWAAPA